MCLVGDDRPFSWHQMPHVVKLPPYRLIRVVLPPRKLGLTPLVEARYESHIISLATTECLAASKPTPPQVADLERLLAAANQRCIALEARLALLERELVEAEGGEVRSRGGGRWCPVSL